MLGGEPPQLSSCKQNMHSTWWVGSGGALVAGTCGDKQTSGCEDHKYAHMYRRVGGMMTNVHVAILSKSLHICENLPPALHVVISVTCVLGGEPPQLSSCKQNMHSTWWVGSGGALVAGTCERMFDFVVACKGLRSINRKVEVIEDFDSRPHKPVIFEVRCQKELQDVMWCHESALGVGVCNGQTSGFFRMFSDGINFRHDRFFIGRVRMFSGTDVQQQHVRGGVFVFSVFPVVGQPLCKSTEV